MFRILLASITSLALTACAHSPSAPSGGSNAARPKLVLLIMVDGLPMEQIYKHQDLFVTNGFRRYLDAGAWYADAHQAHALTLTAPGHAAVATGAYTHQHGILGNDWRERDGTYVYNTSDLAHKYLDGTETTQDDGTSPKRLQASTFGDELIYATQAQSRVFGLSIKDRGAILPAGKTGKAFMYSTKTGRFTSTSYYYEKHPQWWEEFYATKPQDKWFHQRWNLLLPAAHYERSLPDSQKWSSMPRNMANGMGHLYGLGEEKPGRSYYGTLPVGPFADEAMVDFALALQSAENVGLNAKGVPDVLSLSFSAHDYINHSYGPESVQSQDHLLRLDRELARLFDSLDRRIGRENILTVLTADHGFVNAPETNVARGFAATRLNPTQIRNSVTALAEQAFGVPKLITQHLTGGFTLDYGLIEAKKLNREEVENFVARTVVQQPGIAHAFTRTQFERGQLPRTRLGTLAQRGWHTTFPVDVMVVPKPFHFFASTPTDGGNPTACTHGTPYGYDTHVPLMMHGEVWVKPGRVTQYAEVVDIAPTLASILRTRFTSGNEGRVLGEILK